MSRTDSRHIVVVGGGIVGACSALALVRSGHRVTVIETAQPGGTQAASFGNGAFLSPASIIPMSMPGLWKKVPGYLLDTNGPLTIRWKYLLRLLPWLLRFIMAGRSQTKVRRTASVLWSLLSDSPSRHAALAESCGCSELIHRDGLLYVYPDRPAFEQEALAWTIRKENGLEWRELSAADLRDLEPGLSESYTFATVVDSGANCANPGVYVAAIMAQAEREGATVVTASVEGFQIDDKRLEAVATNAGRIACDQAVIAAGIGSRHLVAMLGEHMPLESERGYHVEIRDASITLQRPVMPSDGKMANVMIAGALRASGQVELADVSAPPDWRRADILLEHLRRTYPALAGQTMSENVSRWHGHRPSTPDGLPVISHSAASRDIVYAFGHGHVGLSAAPMTAELVLSLINGAKPPVDPEPYQAARFR